MSDEITMRMMKRMDDKLKELMGKEAHERFSAELAKEAFREEITGMADGEFKDYVLSHFDEITEDG